MTIPAGVKRVATGSPPPTTEAAGPGVTSSTRSSPGFGHGREPLERQRPRRRRGRDHVAHADRAQEAHALPVDPPLEQLHRPVERARDEAGVPVHERAAVREPVEHRERVVLGEGQDEDGALLPREPPRRRRRAGVALEAQGEVGRLDHHQAEGAEHRRPADGPRGRGRRAPRARGSGRGRTATARARRARGPRARGGSGRGRCPARARRRPPPPTRPRRRPDSGAGPRPARRRRGRGDEPGEERVAHGLGVEQPLRQPAPGAVPRRGVGRQRRRVDRHGLQRELLALERPHAEVGVHHGPQDRGREQEAGGEPPELARLAGRRRAATAMATARAAAVIAPR